MFLVNSRYPRFSATGFRSEGKPLHVRPAHLLPKLRCNFAEFLKQGSLKRLGIFSPPTCVGFRYGHHTVSTRGFSWKHGISQLRLRPEGRCLLIASRRWQSSVCRLRVLELPSTGLNHHNHTVADLSFSVPSSFDDRMMVQEY